MLVQLVCVCVFALVLFMLNSITDTFTRATQTFVTYIVHGPAYVWSWIKGHILNLIEKDVTNLAASIDHDAKVVAGALEVAYEDAETAVSRTISTGIADVNTVVADVSSAVDSGFHTVESRVEGVVDGIERTFKEGVTDISDVFNKLKTL